MDVVELKYDRKKRYSIFQFVNMDESEREKYKNNIVCNECGADAYYRGPAIDGKIACFGAKHAKDCINRSSNKSNNEQGDEEVSEIELETSQFDVRWNYISTNNEKKIVGVEGDEEYCGENKRKYTKKPAIEKSAKISLKQILEFAKLDIIDDQDYSITVGNNSVLLKDIVTTLDEINDSSLDKEMFYWGQISSFNEEWINTKYVNKISILIDSSIKEKFWKTYKTKILKSIKNNYIIIFGEVRKSTKGNYYITLKDTKYFYFKKAK